MDRQIVYVGAVPTDTDHLLQSRNTLVGLGYLAKAVIGDGQAYADGLGCSAATGLAVAIGPGSLIVPSVIDTDYFGSLPPNSDPVVKIAVNTEATTLTIPAAGATYLVAGCFEEVHGGVSLLPYYNAANPTQTLFGAGGNGTSQATVLQERVGLELVSGTQAPTGYYPLWLVTVPAGATAIDATMIQVASGAPFLPLKLPAAAPLGSPAFTGIPTAPTPAAGDLSTRLATTQFLTGYVNKAGDQMTGALGVPEVYQMSNNLAVQDPVANVVTGSIYTPGQITVFNVNTAAATLGIARQTNGSAIVNFTSATDAGATLNIGSISLSVTNGTASGVNYNTTSDYRLKTDIIGIDGANALHAIERLQPVSYRWKGAEGPARTHGFIAHEFGEVYPAALVGQKDAVDANGDILPQMIDQTKVIPDLVAAVIGLSARVAALETAMAKDGELRGHTGYN